jgi:MoaA/NifB/PqqE/SkfB family radical SAM enzyme
MRYSGDTLSLAIPEEFDLRAAGRGFTMHGWDFTRAVLSSAIRDHRMLNPAFELGTNACPWNCEHCFTESPDNPVGQKRRLLGELDLPRKLQLINEAADLGAKTINLVGAGEPTIDPNFFQLIETMRDRGITPIVYSEGSQRLTDPEFVRRLRALDATVVLKMNSLTNSKYQNSVVRGNGTKTNPTASDYTQLRNQALDLLLEAGFAREEPTRLAFDTIICQQNLSDIPQLHEFARTNNIFVLFVSYLPSGRSSSTPFDAITFEEQNQIFAELARIDEEKFGIKHRSCFPYAGGVPCSIRGLGLFLKITGRVFACPGEMVELGDVRKHPLSEIWESIKPITATFDGMCAPRIAAWSEVRRPGHLRVVNG